MRNRMSVACEEMSIPVDVKTPPIIAVAREPNLEQDAPATGPVKVIKMHILLFIVYRNEMQMA